jgi:hypothetical protein
VRAEDGIVDAVREPNNLLDDRALHYALFHARHAGGASVALELREAPIQLIIGAIQLRRHVAHVARRQLEWRRLVNVQHREPRVMGECHINRHLQRALRVLRKVGE